MCVCVRVRVVCVWCACVCFVVFFCLFYLVTGHIALNFELLRMPDLKGGPIMNSLVQKCMGSYLMKG